jgi:hypothetical protein
MCLPESFPEALFSSFWQGKARNPRGSPRPPRRKIRPKMQLDSTRMVQPMVVRPLALLPSAAMRCRWKELSAASNCRSCVTAGEAKAGDLEDLSSPPCAGYFRVELEVVCSCLEGFMRLSYMAACCACGALVQKSRSMAECSVLLSQSIGSRVSKASKLLHWSLTTARWRTETEYGECGAGTSIALPSTTTNTLHWK